MTNITQMETAIMPSWLYRIYAKVLSKLKRVRLRTYMAFKKRTYQLSPDRLYNTFFSPKTILFFPDFPSRDNYAIRIICEVLGCRLTQDPNHDLIDLAIRWEDKTHKTDHAQFDDIQRKYTFINHQCNDISKKTVQTVFEDVFGFPLAVDPVTYHGTCVMKSNTNSRHDGRLIQCPIDSDEVKSDHVYEKLIDNQYDASLTQEFRIPVFKEHIPFVYLKYRPIEARFRIYTKLEIAKNKVSDLFSGEEIDAIMQFCRRIGLDYGELDVLRDKNDKHIYIVDVNDTPWGEPKSRTDRTHWQSVKMMAETFETVFIA